MNKKYSLKKNDIGLCILSYKRLKNLKEVIKKVKKYTSLKDTIYIFSDNVNEEKNIEEQNKVRSVIKFLKNLKNKKFRIIFQKKNLGLKKNWESAYEFMFKKYTKVICLQDDDLIKKNFINYMIYYLNKYENNKRVMNITGFASKIYLPKDYKYDSYFTMRSMSYTQASWRRVWKLFKKLNKNHKKIFKDKRKKKLLNQAGTDLLPLLILDYLKIVDSIQIWWTWNIIKNNGLCLNPTSSYVNNLGFDDGLATHYYKRKILQNSFDKNKTLRLNKIIHNEKIDKSFQSNYNCSKFTFYLFNFFPNNFIKKIYFIKKLLKTYA